MPAAPLVAEYIESLLNGLPPLPLAPVKTSLMPPLGSWHEPRV